MPPRLGLSSALRAVKASSSGSQCLRLFSSTPAGSASTVAQRRRHQDPYAIAQARARKAANLSRQEALRTARSKALGDPVRGITTPFVESFDKALTLKDDTSATAGRGGAFLNHFVSPSELEQSMENSRELALPRPAGFNDIAKYEAAVEESQSEHERAREAMARITSIDLSSGKDRLHVNIQRCIDTFGRHHTDGILAAKPSRQEGAVEKTPRAGPDTGSSEVQIAILTAKIRQLGNFLETRGRKDMVNKRNLRLLVHRRQKLLKYLRRKERGGERWQNVMATLGLTEGSYVGEISM